MENVSVITDWIYGFWEKEENIVEKDVKNRNNLEVQHMDMYTQLSTRYARYPTKSRCL